MKKSVEFELSCHEIYSSFEIDTRLSKETWFIFMMLQRLRSQECNNFQLFNVAKITRNYDTPVTCDNIGNYVIKRQSQRHIIIVTSDSVTININLAFRSSFSFRLF